MYGNPLKHRQIKTRVYDIYLQQITKKLTVNFIILPFTVAHHDASQNQIYDIQQNEDAKSNQICDFQNIGHLRSTEAATAKS